VNIYIKFCILFAMLWCHAIDDYAIQGCLANLKQKKWWQEHAPQPLYKNDYIIALIMHSLSWSFSISIPILIAAVLWENSVLLPVLPLFYILNTIVHAIVDDAKANRFEINLIQDQLIHIVQIVIVWIVTLF